MIEIRITIQQAEALSLLLGNVLYMGEQSPNISSVLGLDKIRRAQIEGIKNKISKLT